MEKAQNNIQAFTIIIGTQLLPIITDLLNLVMPFIQSVIEWAKENPKLTKTIVIMALVIGSLLLALSAIAGIVSIVTGGIAALTTVFALFNIVVSANVIGLFILAIVALIALVVVIISL
jgi:hypothetical protein